ncbi:MAG: hypothetical protein KA774_18115 [Burkholderiaceae bacterium]|nr:hypothetical protein [Burkholderiaceae bacterium]
MNTTTRRFPRTLADAYPCERHVALTGPYSRPTFIRQACRVALWLGAFAFIGALIGVSC